PLRVFIAITLLTAAQVVWDPCPTKPSIIYREGTAFLLKAALVKLRRLGAWRIRSLERPSRNVRRRTDPLEEISSPIGRGSSTEKILRSRGAVLHVKLMLSARG